MRLVGQQQHEGWVPGLVLLDSPGAHLLGQRTLQRPWEWRPQEGVKITKKSKTIQFGPRSYGACD